jgi:hypothetical protein
MNEVLVADVVRACLMFMAGICIAMKVPILRYHAETLHWFRKGRMRFDDLGPPLLLRTLGHVLALTFIAVELASHLGNKLTWRSPAALLIFSVSIAGLVVTHRRDKAARTAIRRDEDLT